MGRKCSYPECKNTEGLHSLPSNREMAHRWLHALGRVDIPSASVYVCNLHFTRDCFSNYAEVEMGFRKQLLLNPDAVPTPAKAVTRVSKVSSPAFIYHDLQATLVWSPFLKREDAFVIPPGLRWQRLWNFACCKTRRLPDRHPREKVCRHTTIHKNSAESLPKYSDPGESAQQRLRCVHPHLPFGQSITVPTTNNSKETIQETSTQPYRGGGRPFTMQLVYGGS